MVKHSTESTKNLILSRWKIAFCFEETSTDILKIQSLLKPRSKRFFLWSRYNFFYVRDITAFTFMDITVLYCFNCSIYRGDRFKILLSFCKINFRVRAWIFNTFYSLTFFLPSSTNFFSANPYIFIYLYFTVKLFFN